MKDNDLVKKQAEVAIALEREISAKVAEYKALQDKLTAEWKTVEGLMIDGDIKKIEGDWGSLTIAERLDFDINMDVLAPRFKKTVADTTKIRTMFQLDRKPITGATPKYKKYLTKRIKGEENG